MKKLLKITLWLLLVIALIGVASAIILPGEGYGYTPRAKVAVIILEASSLKPGIEKYINNKLPAKDIDTSEVSKNEYISYVKVSNDGEIILFSESIGTIIVLTPVVSGNSIAWSCHVLPNKNAPQPCRI